MAKESDNVSISLILPCYNVGGYIKECLQSIVDAKLQIEESRNIKVYLINDGSTDNTKSVAEEFVISYPNLFFLHNQENGGVANARNKGLSFVDTDYLVFLDPDDYISPDFFKDIFELIDSNDFDLITYDIQNFYAETGELSEVFKGMEQNCLNTKWTVNGSLASKVIKSSIVDGISFTNNLIYEDAEFSYKILANVNNYYYHSKILYFYRVGRENSITTIRKNKVEDIFTVLKNIYEFFKSNDLLTTENTEGIEYQFIKTLFWSNFYRQIKYSGLNIHDGSLRMRKTKNFLEKYFP
ncbi:TPA: glycosyltransferase family 2 protein, partial [Streptococcus suis]